MECIRADYGVHSHEINALKRLKCENFEGNNDNLRLILRIAAMKHFEESESNAKSSCDQQDVDSDTTSNESPSHPNNGKANKFQHILSLESVTSQMSEDDEAAVAQVAHMLHEVVDSSKNDENFELELPDVEQLMYSVQCNAHRVLDSECRPVALGVFPFTSMMNHSCVPNCAHYFVVEQGKSPRLIMRANRDVSTGEELTYSYVALYDGTSERKKKLMAAYGFLCDCTRCGGKSVASSDSSDPNLENDEMITATFEQKPTLHAAIHKIQHELTVCEQLLSSNPRSAYTVYTKLRSILQSKETDTSVVSPSHKLFVNAYILLVRAGVISLNLEFEEDDICEDKVADICSSVFYYGLLATGFILHFTKVDSIELVSLLISIVHALKTYGENDLKVSSPTSSSFREVCSETLMVGGSGFIFSEDSFVVKTLDEILKTIQSRTIISNANGAGEIVIEDEFSHHTIGRLCYDMLHGIRGHCNIELFEIDLKYLALPLDTIADMIHYNIDIKVEIDKELRRQREEKEEMERQERVELAKAALKSKKGKVSSNTSGGKKATSSQSRENNVNRNAEPLHVIRLVSNRMQREYGAKKRIKP